MDQPAQRIIDAHRVKQRERPLEAGADFERAVGDLVADRDQGGMGKKRASSEAVAPPRPSSSPLSNT